MFIDYGRPEYFVKAQRDYELVLLKNPANMDAHVNLAYLFQITGRFQKAWNQFTVAMETHPSKFSCKSQINSLLDLTLLSLSPQPNRQFTKEELLFAFK